MRLRYLPRERSGPRQADERADRAGDPGERERGNTAEQRLLHHDAHRVEERGRDAEQSAPTRSDAVLRRRARDHGRSGERDRAAGQELRRESLPQGDPGKEGDEDGAEVDKHRGRPRIDASLCLVQGDVVQREPEDAAERNRRQVAKPRQPLTPYDDEQSERDAGDPQPPERESLRRELPRRRADGDERGRPQRDGDERSGRGHPW
jgi:hypothetical protein